MKPCRFCGKGCKPFAVVCDAGVDPPYTALLFLLTWGAGIVWSQCAYCSRMGERRDIASCTAFPARIPQVILSNRADHREVWIDPATGLRGDTGIRGDESLLFDPRPGVDPAVLDDLYRKLDAIRD